MTETNNEAIRFNEINYWINDVHILKNITGSFPGGEITTLVGPSGAGKTTLLSLCNGLKSPTSGEIHIHSNKINTYNPVELRRGVGIALQDATMISGNVRKNLALPLTLQGKKLSHEDAEELMEEVGLDKKILSQNSKDLSGGQRQKLSIARTLVNGPSILLLDEITSSLDHISRQDIEELIRRINRNGTTVVWITHDLDQALSIGTYTWVMMDGELMESGKSNLLKSPKNDKVKQFLQREEMQ